MSAFGSVLAAFRASPAGADACAEAAAAAAAAAATAAARRHAAGEGSGDEDEQGGSSDGEESEEDPEERAAREALQVTRISLGLPPSARLATRGGVGAPERALPQRGPTAAAAAAAADTTADDEDVPTELVPYDPGEAARERWDCDTIVSTYSNLENHPSVIDGGVPRQGRGRGAASRAGTDAAAGAPALIRLGQSGMPVDFVPTRAKKEEAGGAGAGAGAASSDGSEDSDEEGADGGRGAAWRVETRRKGETAEEKRARKAAVKEGRRGARAHKKETKTLFKSATARTAPQTGALPSGASILPMF